MVPLLTIGGDELCINIPQAKDLLKDIYV